MHLRGIKRIPCVNKIIVTIADKIFSIGKVVICEIIIKRAFVLKTADPLAFTKGSTSLFL